MHDLALSNALISDDLSADIAISGQKIAEIGDPATIDAAQIIECSGKRVLPGFIDIHNHGAAGIDVNEADSEGLLAIGRFLLRHGVCGWVPTLVPDSDEAYRRTVQAIDSAARLAQEPPAARILGIHYEGVFANQSMCGALRPEYFRTFSGGELERLPQPSAGSRLMTFAPEVDGGLDLAAELVKEGWIAAIGHTNAGPDLLEKAFQAGARHFTHFFNAMTGIHHRGLGVAGWALTKKEVTFDIIADGIHVHPKMLELAARVKTPGKTLLISDSVAPTGLGDGIFRLWGVEVRVESGRTAGPGGGIAGSVITMLDAVRNMLSLGFSQEEVAAMASGNPARLLGIGHETGSIEKGKRADLVVLGPDLEIDTVIFGGRVIEL